MTLPVPSTPAAISDRPVTRGPASLKEQWAVICGLLIPGAAIHWGALAFRHPLYIAPFGWFLVTLSLVWFERRVLRFRRRGEHVEGI